MKKSSKAITVKRETSESKITLTLSPGPRDPKFKKKIATPLQFFNHMLETVAWRACVNAAVTVDLTDFKLTHVICEDVGICLGEAYLELFNREIEGGINGSGAACSCIDEALARTVVSFEERSLLVMDKKLQGGRGLVEDMQQADLAAFLDGFAQGARATLHVDLLKGNNPHHVWESVFRSFGEALRAAFAPCEWRRGTTPGVKGKVSVEKE
jgi:imidazoleglycerol-phosphate dehydratase